MQELAFDARSDGLDHPDVTKLAKLGDWGNQKANIARDLRNLFPTEDIKLPAPYVFQVPLFDTKVRPPRVVPPSNLVWHYFYL